MTTDTLAYAAARVNLAHHALRRAEIAAADGQRERAEEEARNARSLLYEALALLPAPLYAPAGVGVAGAREAALFGEETRRRQSE